MRTIPSWHLIRVVTIFVAAIASFAPNGMAPLLAVVALSSLFVVGLRSVFLGGVVHLRTAPGVLVALLLLWALVSVSWTIDKTEAITLWLRLFLLFTGGLVLVVAFSELDERGRSALFGVLIGAFVLTAGVVCLERLTDGALIRGLRGVYSEEVDPRIASYFYKNPAAILALFVWPSMAYLATKGRYAGALALLALCMAAVWSSHGRAVMFALAVGLIAWPVFYLFSRAAIMAAAALSGVITATFPILPNTLLDPDWLYQQFSGIMASSARHRYLIWEFTANKIAEKPLLGWGFDSARNIPEGKDAVRPEFASMPGWGGAWVGMPLHPHNGALQVWLELGLPGGLLAAGICAAVFLAISRFAAVDRVTAATLSSGVCVWFVIANLSYGIWQNWWQSTMWIAVAVSVALCRSLSAKDRVNETSA